MWFYITEILSLSHHRNIVPVRKLPKKLQAPDFFQFLATWLSIKTVTPAITPMIQLANLSVVFWRLWKIEDFSYLYYSKLRHFGRWEKFEVFCCNELNIENYLLAFSSWNVVSILWTCINFAPYQIFMKLMLWILHIL